MIESFLEQLKSWASERTDILAVIVVGLWARGTARTDSDIDIVIIGTGQNNLLTDRSWLSKFGQIKSVIPEDWGLVQSLRVTYENKYEVEFGITTKEWLSELEIQSTTGDILRNGMKVVFDPNNIIEPLCS